MQFYYEDKMPLRILDEIEFWKHQESEHTVVIQELVDNLEDRFRTSLQDWEQALSRMQALSHRYIETVTRAGTHLDPRIYEEIMKLIEYSLHQSQDFIVLIDQIAVESSAVLNNRTAIVVLNHIRRESEYFIGISQAILYGVG